jgi:polysaccharide export outer membrane protein
MIKLPTCASPGFFLGVALIVSLFGATAHAQESLAARERDPQSLSMRPALDEPQQGTLSDYQLGTGDKVHVTVYGEDDLSGVFQIDAKGFVQIPLVGAIPAAGGTAADLESKLAAALSDGYVLNPRVSVEVTQYRPFYVIGQVARPGQYDYINAMSVPNAIALAGGYTVKAVESWVYIRHVGQNEERRVPADETTKLEPGDVMRVPDTAFWSVMDVLSPITSLGSAAIPRP